MLDKENIQYKTLDLDEHTNGPKIFERLKHISNQPHLPNLYVGGNHVGGYDETEMAFETGKIYKMLELSKKAQPQFSKKGVV